MGKSFPGQPLRPRVQPIQNPRGIEGDMRLIERRFAMLLFLVLFPFVARSVTVVQLPDTTAEVEQTLQVPVVVSQFNGVAVFEMYISHTS